MTKTTTKKKREEAMRNKAGTSKRQSPTTLATLLLLRIPAQRQPGETKRGECLMARISCHVGCPRQRRPGETKSRNGLQDHVGRAGTLAAMRNKARRLPDGEILQVTLAAITSPHRAAVRNKAENLELFSATSAAHPHPHSHAKQS